MRYKMNAWMYCAHWLQILFIALVACNPDDESGKGPSSKEDPLEPKPVITTTVTGVVVDETGKPVSNATVTVHGESLTTKPDGGFYFREIEVPGNRCVVMASKEGYFLASRAHNPVENGSTEIRLVLMSSPVTHTFSSGSGTSATLDNGSKVEIAPNSLVTSTGSEYSGQVQMSVRYLDPLAGNFGVLVPGGDMLARRTDETTSVLYSYGILRVLMTDEAGQPLQLAAGKTSTLVMDIPDEQLSTAPETIPLWYFDDDKGLWMEDGSAKKEGDQYVGVVSHFTDWNCDLPTEGATIVGRLVDCDGMPAWGIVEFGQISSDPQSSTETGQMDGKFSRRVPDGVSITVVISDPLIVSPLTQHERGKVIVVVPPLSPGQVYDVGDIQTYPCPVHVKATIKTKEDDNIEMIYFSSNWGMKNFYSTESDFTTTLPPDQKFIMNIYTTKGVVIQREIQTPGAGEELDLGLIDISGDQLIDQEVTITGKTMCFSTPENQGQISVSWQDESGTAFNYTTPESDGSFSIAVPKNTTVFLSSSTEHGRWQETIETGNSGAIDLGVREICDSQLVGETSFRINGDGFEDSLVTVVQNVNLQMINAAIYYPSEDLTICLISDMSEDVGIVIHFEGQETGSRGNNSVSGITIRIKNGNRETQYWAHPDFPGSSLQLTINKYDEVGGVVEGTFSGKMLVQKDGAITGETVNVNEGKFSVIRYSDSI